MPSPDEAICRAEYLCPESQRARDAPPRAAMLPTARACESRPDQTLNGNKLQLKKKKKNKAGSPCDGLGKQTHLYYLRIWSCSAPKRNMAMAAVASDPNRVQASIVPTGVVQHRPSSVAGTAGDARDRMQSCLVILFYFIYLILFYPTYFLPFPSVAAGPVSPAGPGWSPAAVVGGSATIIRGG